MRPTLLNFRSPKEKTPEFYQVQMTNTGEHLNFRSTSINKKKSIMPQAIRFHEQSVYAGGSGVSCFNGPGAYKDQENFLKLKQLPCPSKMVIK